jgi:hypothetical protein
MLKITVTGNELYDFVRVDPGTDDSAVSLALKTATEEAEKFLNTDFEGLEAPAGVKNWVFNRVAQLYDNRGTTIKPDFAFIHPWRSLPFRG